jgi:hypothetical protein
VLDTNEKVRVKVWDSQGKEESRSHKTPVKLKIRENDTLLTSIIRPFVIDYDVMY